LFELLPIQTKFVQKFAQPVCIVDHGFCWRDWSRTSDSRRCASGDGLQCKRSNWWKMPPLSQGLNEAGTWTHASLPERRSIVQAIEQKAIPGAYLLLEVMPPHSNKGTI
jgi:hypothetical protein